MPSEYELIGNGSVTIFSVNGQVMIAVPQVGVGVSLDPAEAVGLANAILIMVKNMSNNGVLQ